MTSKQAPEKIHEATDRLYKTTSDLKLIDSSKRQSQLARLLNVGSQNVKNWEARGPSKEALLYCQQRFGIDATYIETGKPFVSAITNPSEFNLQKESQLLVDGYRAADAKDRELMLFLANRALKPAKPNQPSGFSVESKTIYPALPTKETHD